MCSKFVFIIFTRLVAAGLGSGLRGPSIVTMAVNQSAVWSVATVDKDDNSIVWCNIKNRDECKKPIKRGGTNSRNYSTTVIKRQYI